VVPGTGEVLYTPNTNYEGNDSIIVSVSDGYLTDSVALSLELTGVNDPPSITGGAEPLSLSLMEDSSLSYDLNHTDPDGYDTASWSLSSEASSGTASMDAGTGILSYVPNADFSGSDRVTVLLTDGGGLTDSLEVVLTVNPVNDAPVIVQGDGPLPYFPFEDTNFTIDLNATDVDGDVLSWSIASDPSHGVASVVPGTGEVLYTPNTNYEGNDSIIVSVSDGYLTDSVALSLNLTGVNDSPDSISSVNQLFVSEGLAVGSFVGQLLTTDPDDVTNFSYALTSGFGDTDNDLFIIESNGTIKSAVIFDYEFNASSYGIRVQVKDQNNASFEGNFTVLLGNLNESPSIEQNLSFSLLENDNTTIFQISANDPDIGSTLLYSLSGPDADQFLLNASTGELSFVQTPDFEAMGSSTGNNLYHLSVMVSDGIIETQSKVTVEVIDVDEVPPNSFPYNLNAPAPLVISENLSAGVLVGIVEALDPDSDRLTYHLEAGEGDTDNPKFLMEQNGSLYTAESFDFEMGAILSIRVQAKDPLDYAVEAIMLVEVMDIDEVDPVLELNGDSSLVHTLGMPFTDPGARWADNTDGEGTIVSEIELNVDKTGMVQLTYEYIDQAGNSSPKLVRTVTVADLTSPKIELVGLEKIQHPLGFEFVEPGAQAMDDLDGNLTDRIIITGDIDTSNPGTYTLFYEVEDAAGNLSPSVSREVIVYNSDPIDLLISENQIAENQPVGTVVGSLSTVDPNDPQAVGLYDYELLTDLADFPFDLSESGELTTNRVLDFESQSAYELHIRVQDAFGGSLEKSLSIEVIDEFIPIVDTLEVNEVGATSAWATGMVLDTGGISEVLERGILVAEFPEPKIDDLGTTVFLNVEESSESFSLALVGLQPGTKYYARAFASNYEGVGYGYSLSFETFDDGYWPSWSDAEPVLSGEGWWSSPWFGSFYDLNANGWIMHETLGWIFVLPADSSGIWFWSEEFGWCWSANGTFPYFYLHSKQSWMYLHKGTKGQHLVYDYAEDRWIVLNSTNQF